MAKGVVDIFLVYQFLKRLVTPFEKWDAFNAGVLDKDGKVITKKDDRTPEQDKTWGYYDRLLANLKKLLGKLPGGKTRLASFAAALLLLREQDARLLNDPSFLSEELRNTMKELNENSNRNYSDLKKLMEDAPSNATGASVAGTGDDPAHWSKRQPKVGPKGKLKKYGQGFDATAFLRRRRAIQAQMAVKNK